MDSGPCEDVVAPLDSLLEAERQKQGAKVGEPDISIRSTMQEALEYRVSHIPLCLGSIRRRLPPLSVLCPGQSFVARCTMVWKHEFS